VRSARSGFADLLDGLYPLKTGWLDWPQPDTVVCRCEDARKCPGPRSARRSRTARGTSVR